MIGRSLAFPGILNLKERWQPGPVRFWRELAALSLFLLGLSWGIPWFRALSAATQSVSPAHALRVFSAIGFSAYLLVRALVGFQISLRARRQVLVVGVIAAIAFGLRTILYAKETIPLTELVMRPLWALGNFNALIPNEIIVIVAVVLVFRRAAVLALDYIGPGRVLDEFKNGFVMFLLFVLIITMVTGEQVSDSELLMFIYSGLAGMGAARLDSIGELRGAVKTRLTWRRGLSMLLGMTMTAVTAYQVGRAFGADNGALAGIVLGGVVLAAFIVSIPLLLLLLYALFFVIALFEGQVSQAMNRLLEVVDEMLAFLDSLRGILQEVAEFLADKLAFLAPVFRALASAAPAVRTIVLIAAVVGPILLVLAVMAIRQRARRRREGIEESTALDLQSLLQRLRSGLRTRLQKPNIVIALFDAESRRRLLAARIRPMYAQLIRMAAEMGRPRGSAQTPEEFSASLVKLIPGEEEAIMVMTRAYERIRYGELPEETAEVAAVAEAWASIRAARKRREAGRRR